MLGRVSENVTTLQHPKIGLFTIAVGAIGIEIVVFDLMMLRNRELEAASLHDIAMLIVVVDLKELDIIKEWLDTLELRIPGQLWMSVS